MELIVKVNSSAIIGQSAKKVLIVEDSKVINKLLVHSITSQLFIDVETAFSLQEAKDILKKHHNEFFLAVIDLNLPDAPKGEIVDLVIKHAIPPIILTASMSDDLHDEMLEKPIVDYVIKRNLNEIEYVLQTIQRINDNHKRSVLVVDDSISSRKLISSLLRRHNLCVIEAEDGETALRMLNKYKDIPLIITDFNMPGMDGMELTTKIREKFSRTEIAIIGISASGCGTMSTQFLKSGANDFIARPFMHEEFFCRVNQNLDAILSYKKLKDTADRDYLTGIHNRAYLFKTGEKLLQNAHRNSFSICTAMIDIDHFKKVNDTYGHHIGDQMLKHVTNIFNSQMRESDIFSRIGGEEFCLLCINLDVEGALILFDRIVKVISESPLIIEDLTISVTISIGYTMTLGGCLDEMLKEADKALYQAKESGRNQKCCLDENVNQWSIPASNDLSKSEYPSSIE